MGARCRPLLPRLLSKIAMPDNPADCWIWTGARITSTGYGRISAGNELGGPAVWMAHRATYTRMRGPIPDGLDLDHLCRNRICVNPDHLEAVTRRVNTLRSPIAPSAINARKEACNSGHDYTPENTYVSSRGYRQCRTCHRINEAGRRAARRGA